MIDVRRLRAVGALLGLAAVVTCTHVWGEPGRDKARPWQLGDGRNHNPAKVDDRFTEDLAHSRFADQPLVLYRDDKGGNGQGEAVFALQLRPRLDDAPARPRDYLVLVDTSASKALGPFLTQARQIARELAARVGPDDRIALWTVNLDTRDLSRGFKPGAGLAGALKELEREFPAGAVNLKDGLAKAVEAFEGGEGRQRVLLLLGDGKSIAGPVDNDSRAALCAKMVERRIGFFSVPLGLQPEPLNLHGFPSSTGGRCVRLEAKDDLKAFIDRLQRAVAEPVLSPTEFKLPAAVTEAFPATLPPLRRDVPTLVVGRIK